MERNKDHPLVFVVMGFGFLVVGLYDLIFASEKTNAGIVFLITGLIFAFIGLKRLTGPKQDLIIDERKMQNTYKAGYRAYWVILMVNLILISLHGFKISPFPIDFTIGVMFLTGLSTGVFVLLKYYYERKG